VPRYPILWELTFRLGISILSRKSRSFRKDAVGCMARLHPPFRVVGREHIPKAGPCLVTVNHYAQPGFRAWWIALGISAILPFEVHWVITAAWTYPDSLRAHTLTPVTRWLLRRIAEVYGFTTMPPMPPDPNEVQARAEAVRRVLKYTRSNACPVIGLAPEGMDMAQGKLSMPPPGVGRFITHLADSRLPILPVGAYETENRFCLGFGLPYLMDIPPNLGSQERDLAASHTVMLHIARLLPHGLRGDFDKELPA
jgi:hypothetical protein